MSQIITAGVDISLTGTGITSSLGWSEKVGRDGVSKLPLEQRSDAIGDLADQITDLLRGVDLVVLEQVAAAAAYGGASERAGLFWLVVKRLRAREIPVAEVPPSVLKLYALGKGSGTKGAVIDAVARRWPGFETKGDDDICDAVVLCAMGADHLGVPLAQMPAPHRKALTKITWPEEA